MGVMQINFWIPAETGGGEAVSVVVRVTGGKATLSVAGRSGLEASPDIGEIEDEAVGEAIGGDLLYAQ